MIDRLRRIQRWWATLQLDRVDAEVARWYVDDGQLSLAPLDGAASEELRERRLRAVARLERAGGRDPWLSVLRTPTPAQRAARGRR